MLRHAQHETPNMSTSATNAAHPLMVVTWGHTQDWSPDRTAPPARPASPQPAPLARLTPNPTHLNEITDAKIKVQRAVDREHGKRRHGGVPRAGPRPPTGKLAPQSLPRSHRHSHTPARTQQYYHTRCEGMGRAYQGGGIAVCRWRAAACAATLWCAAVPANRGDLSTRRAHHTHRRTKRRLTTTLSCA